ncbi:F-actin-capping protein subunit alpha [Polyrhizophydium stewartii]|uniref:F-actin-capping protein subunit alpha n=1 Tax=Polyrhizophydium stewartii TaxID=2732419 RepID=A0ABR4N1N0_9FUNG
MSDGDKRDIAAAFIRDSPPGEINDVFNDVRALVGDDALLQQVIEPAFEAHHHEQLVAVAVPDSDYQVILGEHGRVEPGHYIDPRSGQLLVVDLVHQKVLSVQPHEQKHPQHLLDQRSALDHAIQEYAASFYPSSVSTVWATDDGALVAAIVANKYNPDNFWSGRWRSVWRIHPGSTELTGSAKAQVHYYEDGNVQNNTSREFSVVIEALDDPAALAAAVVKLIKKHETDYQIALNETQERLSSDMFKSLRRALPLTRNKIDWPSILSYKIGSELSSK